MNTKEGVEVIDRLSDQLGCVANAITPRGVAGGRDEYGGHIESLTESVMGITRGLSNIASAIESLADAVREHD